MQSIYQVFPVSEQEQFVISIILPRLNEETQVLIIIERVDLPLIVHVQIKLSIDTLVLNGFNSNSIDKWDTKLLVQIVHWLERRKESCFWTCSMFENKIFEIFVSLNTVFELIKHLYIT